MSLHRKRRIRNILLTLGVCILIFCVHEILKRALYRVPFFSGWMLLLCIIFLGLYNARKKLPFLPLGKSSTWLQWHLYVGMSAVFLFGLHLYPHLPESYLGRSLCILLLVVVITGFMGIFISRNFAARLTTRGGEVIFERIPFEMRKLREQAEELAVRSVQDTDVDTIARFYSDRLRSFFQSPRNVIYHLFESAKPWKRLEGEFRSLERFLNATEMEILEELHALASAKNDLDYHFALQGGLKYWLFLHIPATFAMIVLIAVHVVAVYLYHG